MRYTQISSAIAGLLLSAYSQAGAFVFAGEANGVNSRTHPTNYTGTGGNLANLSICLDISVPTTAAVANQAEPAIVKAVQTFNRQRSIPNNNLAFFGATDISVFGDVDFESTLLHEMGHCQGLAHPNHATESGIPEPGRNGTKSTDGVDNVFNQAAGADGNHGSSDDVRGDDINLHWFQRGVNNPGLLAASFGNNILVRDPTGNMPAGHLFPANADRTVLAALGFPNAEAVMQQGAFNNEAQRHMQADDVQTLRFARAGLDGIQGNSDDYRYQLQYVGQLNNPSSAACNLRVRFDLSTGFAVCGTGGTFLPGGDVRVTTAELAFNSDTAWYYSPGANTTTVITSVTPSQANAAEPVTVRVAVREASVAITGEPQGVVEVRDGPAGDYFTATCRITLAGTVNEIASCSLLPRRTGARTLTAQYLGFAGWDASAGTASLAVRELSILEIAPTAVRTGQSARVRVVLDAGVMPAPTGTITVSDGVDSCAIVLPTTSCFWSSSTPGNKQLRADYPGDANHPAMMSTRVALQVGPNQYPELISVPAIAGSPTQFLNSVSASQQGISDDGRFIVFVGNNEWNTGVAFVSEGVFVFDQQTGVTELIAGASPGSGGFAPAISGNGRFVAFVSAATNLVAGDGNGVQDIFLFDRQSKLMRRVSVSTSGGDSNDVSFTPSLSFDGNSVAFLSSATNLIVGGTTGNQVFVRDMAAANTVAASRAPNGDLSTNGTNAPILSRNGNRVAFLTNTALVTPLDNDGRPDVYVRDLLSNETFLASVNSTGGHIVNTVASAPSISADGNRVSFVTTRILVPADNNNQADVYVRDFALVATIQGSVADDESQPNSASTSGRLSADGNQLLFLSSASNLVAGGGFFEDAFVRHLGNLTTQRISNNTGGNEPNNNSAPIAISATGDWVFFVSSATDLVTPTPLGFGSIGYLRDRSGNSTRLLAPDNNLFVANGDSTRNAISTDGNTVVFASTASNLVAGDSNTFEDIFVRDRTTLLNARVSVSSAGVQANNGSFRPAISGDGRFVSFASAATNLVVGDINAVNDVFLRDLQSNQTERINIATGGAEGNGFSQESSISADGRYVAFTSRASNLVAGDGNGVNDIFLRDRQLGTTVRVSEASGGGDANAESSFPVLSADGRFVAFQSTASNLIVGDVLGFRDVFVRDMQLGTTQRVSVTTGGTEGNNNSDQFGFSRNGRFVAFVSQASNLVAGDTNVSGDVFLRDLQNSTTILASITQAGGQSSGFPFEPEVSNDGRYVLFFSNASDLTAGDTGTDNDVFMRDTVANTTTRLSVKINGEEGEGFSPSLSDNGFVAFDGSARGISIGDSSAADVHVVRIPNFVAGNSTTTAITADTPDPSVVNAGYLVSVSVLRTFAGANVTGSVFVSDGSEFCTATLSGSGASATGSCTLVSSTTGAKLLLANYNGDANHAPSQSTAEPHLVNTTSVTGFSVIGDSPDPSRLERVAAFTWNLTPAPIAPLEPGRSAAVPTGSVTVKEAANCAAAPVLAQHQCSATLPASSCEIAFASIGSKTMQVCYSGDSNFAPASATETHDVIFATVPVSLAQIRSQRIAADTVEVRFSTASNVGTTAFDIAIAGDGSRSSRAEDGARLTAASELLASQGDAVRAASYVLRAQLSGDSYYLRGFDADGSIESFGPFSVGVSAGADPNLDAAPYDWSAARTQLSQWTQQRSAIALPAGSASIGVYLKVTHAGIHAISAADLTSAGFTAFEGTPIAELALSTSVLRDGSRSMRAVPIAISSIDAFWNAGDSLQFVGQPVDSQHSGERSYTLARDPAFVSRIVASTSLPAAVSAVRVLPQQTDLRQRLLFSPTSTGDSPWTWVRLAATSAAVSQTVSLQLPNALDTSALLTLRLQGGVDHSGANLDHHVQVLLNNTLLGSVRFDGVRSHVQTMFVPAGLLQPGTNQLTLRLPADTGLPSDVVSLESVQIEANERLVPVDGRLLVQIPTDADAFYANGFEAGIDSASARITLSLAGLTAEAIVLQAASEQADAVVSLPAFRIESSERVLLANKGSRLYSAEPASMHRPIVAPIVAHLNILQGAAQYLVISHPQFANALTPLMNARAAEGLSTKLVSTEQIYAAYSGGEVAVDAIASYVRDAQNILGTEYVLLVGGDTLDARGFQNSGSLSFVPTRYVQTSNLVRFAPSDAALADTDKNGVPDLAIGRLPVRSATELDAVLAKTLLNHNNNRVLMVADRSEPGLSFKAINDDLALLLPNFQLRRAERDLLSAEAVRQAIVDEANSGVKWLQYFGHASPARWSFDNILTVSQLQNGLLTNSTQPVNVLQWACWTNYFVDPSHNTLGHAWLNQNAGARLVLGPSTLTETAHDEALAKLLAQLLNGNPNRPLGKALLEAKQLLHVNQPGYRDVQLGVNLLGDPAAR